MTMLVLAALAIAGVIVVLVVRDAEQKAIVKADEAEAANARVEAQYQELKDEKTKRDTAEKAAQEAAAKEAAEHKDTLQSREDLQKSNVRLKAAADAANAATAKAEALAEKLQAMYDDQKRQNAALLKQRKGIATTLK
jgi:hypothetical protein